MIISLGSHTLHTSVQVSCPPEGVARRSVLPTLEMSGSVHTWGWEGPGQNTLVA